MNTERAFEIVSLLADGIDPYTGEVFSEGPYQHPDTVRALFKAKDGLIRMINYEKRQKRLPDNAGMKWSKKEDNQLVAEFDAGTEINELAEMHMRTKGAITRRLLRLGKIDRG